MRPRFVLALLALALLVPFATLAVTATGPSPADPVAVPLQAPAVDGPAAEVAAPEAPALLELLDPQEPVLRTCAGDCFRTYRTCYQNCLADAFCESLCKAEYDDCRAACP